MKRNNRLSVICACFALCLGLAGCASGSSGNTGSLPPSANLPIEKLPTHADVTLTANQAVLPAGTKVVQATLSNKSRREIYYGDPYILEKKENGGWTQVQEKEDVHWTMPLYNMPAGGKKDFTFSAEPFTDRLEPGTYRFSKDFYFQKGDNRSTREDYRVSVEFTVE